ncbi:MAG: DUF5794 domain-containing protein [Candidatus Nanohaloarchaea archaeon]
MVLEQLKAGASRHMLKDDGSRELAFILCLPLVDGVFATLLVTGAVSTFSQMINVAVTIFAGAGALAVLYSESETRDEAVQMVNNVIPVVLTGALLVALVAPIFQSLFATGLLKYAAALAVISISLQLADIDIGDRLPPTAIILTGLLLSYQGMNGFSLTLSYVQPALVTVALASIGLYMATVLKKYSMNLTYVRYGGSLVLLLIGLSLLGLNIPQEAGPLLFGVSILISLRR